MKANIEAIKEILRLVLFAVAGYGIQYLINMYASVPTTESTVIILAILRYADKYLHEIGYKGGLSRF